MLAQYVRGADGQSSADLKDSLSGINSALSYRYKEPLSVVTDGGAVSPAVCIIHVKDPTSIEDVAPYPLLAPPLNGDLGAHPAGHGSSLAGTSNGYAASNYVDVVGPPLSAPAKKRKTGSSSSHIAPALANGGTTRKTRSSNRVSPIPRTKGAAAPTLADEGPSPQQQKQYDQAASPLSLPAAFRAKILAELEAAERLAGLGVRFLMVEQGMRIGEGSACAR